MDDLAISFGSSATGMSLSNWIVPVFIIGGLILGLRLKSMATRGMQASQERSMELSTRLASVDVAAMLDNIDAPSQPALPDTDDFFSNSARRNELEQAAEETAPDMEARLRQSMGAAAAAH